MHHPLRDARRRALVALMLVPAFCATPPASAEIFKCTAKNGLALYQNFPCQFDSIGWVPPNPQAAKMPSVPPAASEAAPKAPPVNVASAVEPSETTEPRIGMLPDEVRALLGEPLEIVQDVPVEGIEIWRYVDGTIQFDRTHRVITVQRW